MQELYLFNRDEELIGIVPGEELLAHEQEMELNKFITVYANTLYDPMIESAFYVGNKDIDDESIFYMYRVQQVKTVEGTLEIDAVHCFFDDMKSDGFLKDRRPSKTSVTNVLGIVLEGSRWQIGTVTSSKIASTNFYYESRLSSFWKVLEAWGVEFKLRMTFSQGKITGRYVDIHDKLSDDFGKWFEKGDKLIKVTREVMFEEIYTALIGRGRGLEVVGDDGQPTGGYRRRINFEDVEWSIANGDPLDKPKGQSFLELPSATEVYGFANGNPRIGIIEFDDIEEVDVLIESTYEVLLQTSRPKMDFQAQAMETGLSELGEIVTIIDDETGIRYKTRVFKIKRNFLNRNDKEFTFGDKIVDSRAEQNVAVRKKIEQQDERTTYWLEALRQAVVDSYFNEDGYNYDLAAGNEYDLPGGYYSFDAPIDQNPSKVVYVGAGRILIANSKNPDGTWMWRTAITGDGITLDAVNTGVLTAGRILSALSGSYWDLDNDVFHMENGDIQLLDTETGNLISLDYQGVSTISGSDGSYTRLTPNGSVVSANGLDGRYATLANGRSWYYNEDGSAVLNIGAHQVNGMSGFRKGVLATARAQPLIIGRYDDYLINNPNAKVNPYISLEYEATPGDESRAFIKLWRELSMYGKGVRDIQYLSGYELSIRSTEGRLMLGVLGSDGTPYNTLQIGYANTRSYGNIEMQPGYEVTQASDRRWKNIVGETETKGLEETRKLLVVDYYWKNGDGEKQIGLIAQDSPFLSVKNEDGYYGISGNKLAMLNLLAIQELDDEHQKTKEDLRNTKQELSELKTLLKEKGLI